MILTNKANGKNFPITKEGWNAMSKDQRLRYIVQDASDSQEHFKPAEDNKPVQTVDNQADKKKADKTDKPKEPSEQK